MRHPSARAVGMQDTNDPPCRARGRTRVSSASSRKIACWPKPHRNRHGHLTGFVFSILMDCSAGKLRSRRASLQQQTRDVRSPRAGFLWISPNVAEPRPERPIPAIPPRSKSATPPERRPIGPPRKCRSGRHADCRQEPARRGTDLGRYSDPRCTQHSMKSQ
jgi:hypothetical protein